MALNADSASCAGRPAPFRKSLVVLRRRYAHRIMIGIDGLDEHDPGTLPRPARPGDCVSS